MQLWITSDQHFGHRNMAEVFTLADGTPARPFTTVREMNDTMIARWNDVVKPQDHVWCLGDVSISRDALRVIGPLLHGHKRLIRGNHDIFKTKEYLAAGFEEIRGVSVRNRLVYTHFPIHPLSMARFHANIHGHTHSQPDYDDRYMNVCVEHTNYTPVAVETIESEICRRVALRRVQEHFIAHETE